MAANPHKEKRIILILKFPLRLVIFFLFPMDLSFGPELIALEPIVDIHNRPAARQLTGLAVHIVLEQQLQVSNKLYMHRFQSVRVY